MVLQKLGDWVEVFCLFVCFGWLGLFGFGFVFYCCLNFLKINVFKAL